VSATKELFVTTNRVVDAYNEVAPSESFAMTLGDKIVLSDEEGHVKFIPKWELWLLTQEYATVKEQA